MKELQNYEYLSYEKLDHTNAAHRLLLESFWKGMVERESVVDGLVAHYVSYLKKKNNIKNNKFLNYFIL